MEYPVYETFHSWQGEGVHMGRSAAFIRLFGCPVHCPWCDSAGTWHPDYLPETIAKRSAFDLAAEAAAVRPECVVITGGEPTIHNLEPLAEALTAEGLESHLETCGGFEIRGSMDWVTVSPKWGRPPLPENLERADEIKLIVEDEYTIDEWIQRIGPFPEDRPVWLHPEWSQRKNARVLESITRTVKERGAPFRAGIQAHKYFKADGLDPKSMAPLPLGGNPELGC